MVTLYSVVINDLLIKLEALDEIHEDSTAENILKEVRELQEKDPFKSDWEKIIIDRIKERTELIDNVDYAHFQALRNDRHFCAHPVIDKEEKLYTPNKETVASHIRNMLDSILTKSPVLSKKIFKTLLIDISNKKELLISDESLGKYIITKYLDNVNERVELSIFRSLWKLVFCLSNDDVKENRGINFRVLRLIFSRNLDKCIQMIKEEKEYFSKIIDDFSVLRYLIIFLSDSEFLFDSFLNHVHLLISKHVKDDSGGKVVAWFLSNSYNSHLESLKKWLEDPFNVNNEFIFKPEGEAIRRLLSIGIEKGYKEEVSDFIIWRFSEIDSYYTGDDAFQFYLEPFWNELTKNQLIEICRLGNENPQVYRRRRAFEDHGKLKMYLKSRFDNFDFDRFENIFSSE